MTAALYIIAGLAAYLAAGCALGRFLATRTKEPPMVNASQLSELNALTETLIEKWLESWTDEEVDKILAMHVEHPGTAAVRIVENVPQNVLVALHVQLLLSHAEVRGKVFSVDDLDERLRASREQLGARK